MLLRKRAEEINKRLQDELGEVESRRREIFLKKEKLGEEDFFYEKFGYSYDWVMVFGIEEEDPDVEFEMDERKIKIKQKEWSEKLHVDMDFSKFFSMKTIVDRTASYTRYGRLVHMPALGPTGRLARWNGPMTLSARRTAASACRRALC